MEEGEVLSTHWYPDSHYLHGLQALSHEEGGCGCPVAFLLVPSLPRGAAVEWHFISLSHSDHTVSCNRTVDTLFELAA